MQGSLFSRRLLFSKIVDLMAKPIQVDYTDITTHELTVRKESVLQRLDIYIHKRLPTYSRTLVQKLIKERRITINGDSTKASYGINVGDVIRIEAPKLIVPQVVATDIPLNIIYEDGCMIAINKPPHFVVHPAAGHWDDTLVNALLHHCGDLPETDDIYKPGVVHRIDKDTSGIILAAKTLRAHAALTKQFQDRTIEKEYRTIVEGVVRFDEDWIDKPMDRHRKDMEKMAVVKVGQGKVAQTYYQVLERFDRFSYVRVKPKTGKTHQIRVHMASIGHPCLADSAYGKRDGLFLRDLKVDADPRVKDPLDPLICRQALHAAQIEFTHPLSGERMQLSAPPADDMQLVLELFRDYRKEA